jgi:hypothetical protein
MTFQKGYNWFLLGILCVFVLTLFLPKRGPSSVNSNMLNAPDAGTPAGMDRPSADSLKETGSQSYTSLPNSDSGQVAPKKHYFNEYDCTLDCSGHKAGYEWAERKSIADSYDCDVAGDHYNSPSFAEGCNAYVEGETEPDDDD